MKDVLMLLGFSMGLVTGALLYKYSPCTKQAVDKGEQMVKKELDKLEQKAKQTKND